MSNDTHFDWYLTFVSIVFGVFISVWVEPIVTIWFTKQSETDFIAVEEQWIYLARMVTVFLIFICLWWWYAIFVGHIAPARGFFMYFLDFLTLGLFAYAVRLWHEPVHFALAEMFSSFIMLYRFTQIRPRLDKGSNSYSALRLGILISAGAGILLAIILIYFSFMGVTEYGINELVDELQKEFDQRDKTLKMYFNGVERKIGMWIVAFMIAGVIITILAVRKTEGLTLGHMATFVEPPDKLLFILPELRDKTARNSYFQASHIVERAQHDFEHKIAQSQLTSFRRGNLSTVHSGNDVTVQAKILVIPSLGHRSKRTDVDEVRKKALLTYFGHWLDDVFDSHSGRVARHPSKRANRTLDALAMAVDKNQYDKIPTVLSDYLPRAGSRKFVGMFLWEELVHPFCSIGFSRLFLGSLVFHEGECACRAVEIHKNMLRNVLGSKKEILCGFSPKPDIGIGEIKEDNMDYFVRLTSKTVQELWFGFEIANSKTWRKDRQELQDHFYKSFLYSLLFGPALFFHDKDEEISRQEIGQNWREEECDCDIGGIINSKSADLIRHIGIELQNVDDDRMYLRGLQVQTVAFSFVSVLPQAVREAYEEVGGQLIGRGIASEFSPEVHS